METQTKPETSQSTLAFIRRHAAGNMHWLVLALVAMLISIVTNYLMPQVVRYTLDNVIGAETAALPAFIARAIDALGGRDALRANLIWCAVALLGLSVASGVFNFLSRMGIATGTERFCRTLREKLFRHIQYLPFQWQVENQTGEIIQRCTSDLEVVRNFLATQLLEVLRTFIMMGVALALMFSMNVTLSLVSLAFLPIIALYSIIFYRVVGKRFLTADEAEGELTINVQENLTGVRVVRAFGREKTELDRFDGYNNRFAQLWIKLGHAMSINWGIGDIATGFQIFAVIIVGTILAVNRTITPGEFVVFVTYNQSLAWPVRSLGRTLSEMSKTGVSAARIQEVLNSEEEPDEPSAQTPNLYCDIRFENVTFAYGDQPVLQDLTFTIKKGTTFGILGATGSGKSTITYLLNRLYDLPEGFGNIWFGDVEIRQIDRYYLRKNVGLVLQEPFLFSKTIEENIAIAAPPEEAGAVQHGRPGGQRPQLARIRHAASIAAVDEAISEFDKGYDTVVGERGVTLSGGQKQRVAIARTLMLNAPVMIFDDSMSAVDLETDARIRAALKEKAAGATILLISHRINTLMGADEILVLEDGKIADMGTHRELIARPGTYKRIYDMQSEAAADAGEDLEKLAGLGQGAPAPGEEGGEG